MPVIELIVESLVEVLPQLSLKMAMERHTVTLRLLIAARFIRIFPSEAFGKAMLPLTVDDRLRGRSL
jgi:hypothetical protein